MKVKLILIVTNVFLLVFSGIAQYSPAANEPGTVAIFKDSSIILSWADSIKSFERGPQDISDVGSPLADFGDSTLALGYAEGTSTEVVSLGDGGSIVLGFPYPIRNGNGYDFAVFENGFNHDYLEFAHVEVSTDGINFVRFPSISVVQITTQTGSFGSTAPEEVYNLAGKFIQGYGTPFDLDDVAGSIGINLDSINYVKLIDVVGSIDVSYGTMDSQGNIINEPFPSAFSSGGFDLDAVGVINENNITADLRRVQLEVNVYPNPTNGIIHISSEIQNGTVELMDLTGRVLLREDFSFQKKINMQGMGLTSGIYMLNLNGVQQKIILR
jgi:hypothetical protein